MLILDNEIDDAVLLILSALHADASDQESHRGEPGLSLARLSKRTELRMSTLRRHLTALEDAEIVSVVVNEDGTGRAILTPYGMAIFDALDESQTAGMM
ncbi:helix-turn-helix domain-containing protein [Collimonas pratensis]|uniref:Bacterial regulatory, arsR family protein n=1 Tax=Collimonas pratensis TaxID=279113 RepID=A0A127Q0D6_9BURK|nr:helix-turn-helix domain-containing protein [Collimonas pratensis]AMP03092.1 bacterial regulatory, arsR family protein [Collimonas pratensis]